jgi:hypothetical protein
VGSSPTPGALGVDSLEYFISLKQQINIVQSLHISIIEWSDVYDNPHYWQNYQFNDPIEYSKFTNVASTIGCGLFMIIL